jgi:hypothetical protein
MSLVDIHDAAPGPPNGRASANQTRVTCWLDKDLLAEFHKMHPAHGALSHFIRTSFERYVKRMKADVNKTSR